MVDPIKNIEALIITSKVKYIPEFNSNTLCNSRQTEDINFIPKLLKNIERFSKINKFNIVHDFKIDNKYSIIYQEKLKMLSNKLGFRLITSPSSIRIPSQISATIAFKYGLNKIKSNYFLFWEHDHTFIDEVNWMTIDNCFKNGGKMIRFKRHINSIQKDFKRNKDGTIEHFATSNLSGFDDNILKTNFYSNGPFISEKSFCKKLWAETNYEFPNWNGFFGGFIEGPVNQFMLCEEFNLDNEEFNNKYPIYLYGGDKFEPIVKHKGDYEPIYKIQGNVFKSIIVLLKIIKRNFHNLLYKLNKKFLILK